MPLSNEEDKPTDKFSWKEGDTIYTPDIALDLWKRLPAESREHLEGLGYVEGKAPPEPK